MVGAFERKLDRLQGTNAAYLHGSPTRLSKGTDVSPLGRILSWGRLGPPQRSLPHPHQASSSACWVGRDWSLVASWQAAVAGLQLHQPPHPPRHTPWAPCHPCGPQEGWKPVSCAVSAGRVQALPGWLSQPQPQSQCQQWPHLTGLIHQRKGLQSSLAAIIEIPVYKTVSTNTITEVSTWRWSSLRLWNILISLARQSNSDDLVVRGKD